MPENLKIGVFICHCGTNISGFVDIPSVADYVKTLPNVAHVEHHLYACASNGLKSIQNAINQHNLNRVIVASCTPRTHEPLFRSVCMSASLNPYLFEFVNIREQCSWVHMREKEKATRKAKELIKMGVARAALLQPQDSIKIDVMPEALVIGAGVAGMTAALSLAGQDFKVHLIEKEEVLGGNLRKLHYLFGEDAPQKKLQNLIQKVESNNRIHVYKNTTIANIDGYVGNFKTTILQENEPKVIEHGVIIVATGAIEYKPIEYLYGQDKRIVTQLELEKILANHELTAKRIVMIQCVGARDEIHEYCSRICCGTAIKNALKTKELHPNADVYILYKDIRTYGFKEDFYKKAAENGVIFIRYEDENKPELSIKNGKLQIEVYESILDQKVIINPDLVVLSTANAPNPDNPNLAKLLKVPLNKDGFFLEAHMKLRPVDFASDGIFLCGSAHGPVDTGESITQALGAAARASIPMVNKSVQVEAITAIVDSKKCIGCGICESLCPYGAMRLVDGIANSVEILCKGCGTCAAACPSKAITCRHFTEEQIVAQIEALGGGISVT